MVKRYEHQDGCGGEYDCRMYECSTGNYVAYVDYEKTINSHEKFKTYKTERENIFTLLNEKQLPILGGMCLDSIIRDLVKQFERRQAFIEEHDEAEAYREYEVFCNEQALKQAEKN